MQSFGDRLGGAHRYAFATLLVFAATAARFWADDLIHTQAFPTYFFAVLVTTAVAGAGPAMLATLLSAIAGAFFF
ncbi:MAG: DUF4118 domain-containing protein, partial [Hyphomicrobiales bacterium]